MFGSAILEVSIGIILIFLLVSVICSAIREGIEAKLKSRAAYLERGIRELLNDPKGVGLAKQLYEHPLVYSLYANEYRPGSDRRKALIFARGGSLPSYIPASNFAMALLDIAARGPNVALASDARAARLSLDNVRETIDNIDNEFVQRILLTAIDSAQGDLDRARQNVQAWFDSGMDRVSGWYKRSTQWVVFWIGLSVAVIMNVNAIRIADYLYRNDAARATIVAAAEQAAADSTLIGEGYTQAVGRLQELRLPIGWSEGLSSRSVGTGTNRFWNLWLGPLIGWLITAFAATMGAPFWFDILNKVMVIRSTVKPREKSQEEGSEDRGSRPRQPQPGPFEPAVQPPAAQPAQQLAAAPADGQPPHDHHPVLVGHDHLWDACDVPIDRVTADEDLPPAEGGVA